MHLNLQFSRAYTMIEMALMLLIAGLLFSTVAPVYMKVVEEKKADSSADTIELIGDKIDDFYKTKGYYPDSLSEIYNPVPLDPWGNPYEYLKIEGSASKGKGKLRKDKNLVPINSDYDLYSKGPDGKSTSPLTASISQDDIVRGRNGAFFGKATEF